MTLLTLSFVGTTYGAAPLGGQALLDQDKKQIELLEKKLAELKEAGGDASVIQAYIDLAKEMMELNNERHALHAATQSFAEAVGIFSKKIESNIQKVNEILATQAEAAIKNSKAIALLQPETAVKKSVDKEDEEEKDDK